VGRPAKADSARKRATKASSWLALSRNEHAPRYAGTSISVSAPTALAAASVRSPRRRSMRRAQLAGRHWSAGPRFHSILRAAGERVAERHAGSRGPHHAGTDLVENRLRSRPPPYAHRQAQHSERPSSSALARRLCLCASTSVSGASTFCLSRVVFDLAFVVNRHTRVSGCCLATRSTRSPRRDGRCSDLQVGSTFSGLVHGRTMRLSGRVASRTTREIAPRPDRAHDDNHGRRRRRPRRQGTTR